MPVFWCLSQVNDRVTVIGALDDSRSSKGQPGRLGRCQSRRFHGVVRSASAGPIVGVSLTGGMVPGLRAETQHAKVERE
jgi:hypothetical protein